MDPSMCRVPSGAECTLTISYAPPASGPPGGTITFTDNAALSNLTSTATASGATTFTQSLALSSTVATTAAPSEPPTTINLPTVAEAIPVNDTPVVQVAQPIVILPASLLSGVLNTPDAPVTFTAAGGTGPLSATASSGLPVTFSSLTPSLCTVNGDIVTGIGIGQCIVAADQPGDANFLPAVEVTQTIGI